jgi:thiol:disulfide interchange protein
MIGNLRNSLIASVLAFAAVSSFAADKIFDPTRDSAKDLAAAETQAAAEHKHILLDVGGNWCSWCHLLDRTLHENPALTSALESNYVVVHVNWDPDHENQPFLSHYPKTEGYPYLLVLAADGKLLHAQPTDALETDHHLNAGYNQPAVLEFLNRWAPKR